MAVQDDRSLIVSVEVVFSPKSANIRGVLISLRNQVIELNFVEEICLFTILRIPFEFFVAIGADVVPELELLRLRYEIEGV